MTFLIIYTVIGIILKGFICPWNHHHQHVPTFSSPLLNRLLEIIYGFQTRIVSYAWVLHHNLGHHLHYQDQSLDESAWRSPSGKLYSPFVYTWIVSITAYIRAWQVGTKFPKIQKYFIYACVVQCTLLIMLIAYRPLAGVLIFLIPMISGIIVTVYTTYHHHSGLDSDDPYRASYNIDAPWYNWLTGNLGYHTAHHLKGSLHWSLLPEFHREIAAKIEPRYYKKYNLLWYSTPETHDSQLGQMAQ